MTFGSGAVVGGAAGAKVSASAAVGSRAAAAAAEERKSRRRMWFSGQVVDASFIASRGVNVQWRQPLRMRGIDGVDGALDVVGD